MLRTPYAFPLLTTPSPDNWSLTGVLIAQPLFRQKKITGASITPAKFNAAWKSPVLEPPSPKYTTVQASLPSLFKEYAAPTAWGICVATVDATVK
nr:Uncharacterised protein [Ipomoea batatas]GMC63230.1 Uncharacterised protein [Ipomoea batatas]GMC64587.1 Uncharacterised protein [Ipomoea batatas]GMC66679.1 Uncharacterised protein [Ipomoea batatas]GMC68048.1 Uncharacterised protein [Ipomoea batatas]